MNTQKGGMIKMGRMGRRGKMGRRGRRGRIGFIIPTIQCESTKECILYGLLISIPIAGFLYGMWQMTSQWKKNIEASSATPKFKQTVKNSMWAVRALFIFIAIAIILIFIKSNLL